MKSPGVVIVGVVVALCGLLFTLQGVGIVKGSFMSDTVFWTIAGPVIVIVGIVIAVRGLRDRGR